jgi:hypothetical protein
LPSVSSLRGELTYGGDETSLNVGRRAPALRDWPVEPALHTGKNASATRLALRAMSVALEGEFVEGDGVLREEALLLGLGAIGDDLAERFDPVSQRSAIQTNGPVAAD